MTETMEEFHEVQASTEQAGEQATAVTVNTGPKNEREDGAGGTQTVMGLDLVDIRRRL